VLRSTAKVISTPVKVISSKINTISKTLTQIVKVATGLSQSIGRIFTEVVKIVDPVINVVKLLVGEYLETIKIADTKGHSIHFDGTGYISTPSFAIPNTGILTVEAWMKSNESLSVAQMILGEGAISSTVGCVWILRGQSGVLDFEYSTGSGIVQIIFANFFTNFDNQWIHIMLVSDYANKTLKAYRNGVQFDVTKNLTTPLFPLTNRAKYIGSYNASQFKITDGSLDEVRIYNRGLSPTEVLEHYNGIFKDESNLQLYYGMDEGSGTTVHDGSGNGRDGTMYEGLS